MRIRLPFSIFFFAGSLCFRFLSFAKNIAQKILDKIFQSFFTTKPTGQGNGLGLSLSYDIVKRMMER